MENWSLYKIGLFYLTLSVLATILMQVIKAFNRMIRGEKREKNKKRSPGRPKKSPSKIPK